MQAFGELVERYQRRAASIAYRLLGNVHDALEVVQDAYLRALRSLNALDDPARFGPWLLRIVTNLSLNYRRDRATGGRKVSLDEITGDDARNGFAPAVPPHADTHPGATLAAQELAARAQQALGELPEQQRLALVLFSIEQMPQKEVAAILQCSVEAVKWHVFQARRKLREKLAGFL